MKKIYILFALLCFAYLSKAQVYFTENFGGGTMPPTGWSIDNLAAQWGIGTANNAGGTGGEAKFTWIQQTAMSRLISPMIDLTTASNPTLTFKHMYDRYANGPVIGVGVRIANGPWTVVWSVSPSASIPAETRYVSLTNVNQDSVQFCLYINGNLYNVNYWYIDDIQIFTPLALDAKLMSVDLPYYLLAPATPSLQGKIMNVGYTPVTSFDVAYTVNGGASSVYSVTGLNLAVGATYSFTHNIPLNFTTSGSYIIETKILNVNGGTDLDTTNNVMTQTVGVVPYVPPRKVFTEEATGTWCQWCVRGICFMDYMATTYPDTWIGVAVHNNDPMVYAPYDDAIGSIIPGFTGYPSGTCDRVGNQDPSEFEAGYLDRIGAIVPANLSIQNFAWNATSRVVSFDLQSDFVVDIAHELRYGVVISEDSVYGTVAGWEQHNAYAGGGQGPMCGFETKPAIIPAASMHYDHVARQIYDTPFGYPGSLPATIPGGSTQTYSFTTTIPAGWNYNKLHFIGLLIDMATKEILNSEDVISSYAGIVETNIDDKVGVYPNPFNNVTNVAFTLKKAEVVKVDVCNMLGDVVYSQNARTYGSGANKIQISSDNLTNGVYFVKLTIGNRNYTQKVSVVR
ncbi:MAG: T9SS type A sorting domain-containing protein [Bacteroidetes bacterium]|nr:T9SS type A sorting domain-containing protein [Bacteroidota bacterium]